MTVQTDPIEANTAVSNAGAKKLVSIAANQATTSPAAITMILAMI
jgi:hypothetical protein